MLTDIIDAVLVMNYIRMGVVEDEIKMDAKTFKVLDSDGMVDWYWNARKNWALCVGLNHGSFYNLGESPYYLFHPIQSLKAEQFCDWLLNNS